GVPVAQGTDFYPGPFDPLMSLQGMVTRTGWNGETWGANQAVSVDEALTILTLNGAYASYEEDAKGSISAGKLADYVVLSDDPHIAPDKILDLEIVRTVVGGEAMFER
ncbi:MAG TPA: amidohydrolase family protein, partial [Amaricoccus sp.]|nr:amidohydrolase family protein [Amaricoccus sp.]